MAFNDLKPILTKIDSLYNEIRRSLKINFWKGQSIYNSQK